MPRQELQVSANAPVVENGAINVESKLPADDNVATTNSNDKSTNNQLQSAKKPQSKDVWFNVRDPIASFTGRKQCLKDLHNQIQISREAEDKLTVLSQTSSSQITGLGGIGKTETVRMYISYYGKTYNHVVWIDAEHHSIAEAQIRSLASNQLKIPITSDDSYDSPRKLPDIIKDIFHTLCQKGNLLLLVFDNALYLDDNGKLNDGIRRFLPPPLSSAFVKPVILITSRNQNWINQNVVQLDLWTEKDCILFLANHLSADEKENRQNVLELAEMFDRFPLAMQVVVVLLREQSKRNKLQSSTAKEYGIQELMRDHKVWKLEILKEHSFNSNSNSKTTMLILWYVIMSKIKTDKYGRMAFKVLHSIAYLSPTVIPKDLLNHLFEEHKDDLACTLELLTNYSLIETFKDHITIHPMIQDVTIENMKSGIRQSADQRFRERFQDYYCDEKTTLIQLTSKLETYIPSLSKTSKAFDDSIANVIYVSDYVMDKLSTPQFFKFTEFMAEEVKEIRMDCAIRYFDNLATYSTIVNGRRDKDTQRYRFEMTKIMHSKGRYDDALQNYKEILKEQEIDAASEEFILETKNSIAAVLCSQEKYDEAMVMFMSILQIEKTVLGVQHPMTLCTQHNIASVLEAQGKTSEAFRIYSDVLAARETVLGSSHENTLATKLSIAVILGKQEKYDEAMSVYTDLLEKEKKSLGSNHQFTLRTKLHIASILDKKKKYDEALTIYREVLTVEENLLGKNNSLPLKTKHKIALILSKQGKYDEALRIHSEVLNGEESVLCFGDSLVLQTKRSIATIMKNQGKHETAIKAFNEVLEMTEAAHGSNHPETLVVKYNIASVRENQGKFDKAIEIYLEVIEARKVVLGQDHLDTVEPKSNIATILVKQGKYDEALEMYSELLEAQGKLLGSSHPLVLKTKEDIATVKKHQGKDDEVMEIYSQLLVVQEKELGLKNLLTLTTKYNLGLLYFEKEQLDKAANVLEDVVRLRGEILGYDHIDYQNAKKLYDKCKKKPAEVKSLGETNSKSCCRIS